MNIRTLIVDDEPLARERIKTFLQDEPDISVMGELGTGREAIAAIRETAPELLFLDIQMPGVNGFEVLQAVGQEHWPVVIFVTAYDQYAIRAFEVHALDYLLKPFKQERFKEAVERARSRMGNPELRPVDPQLAALLKKLRPARPFISRFVIRGAQRVLLVKANEVDWIESAANYALLHVGDRTHIVRETMQALEEKLNPRIFQRISRSVIVNVERIHELQPMGRGQYHIVLANGKHLTMSRGIRDLQQALECG